MIPSISKGSQRQAKPPSNRSRIVRRLSITKNNFRRYWILLIMMLPLTAVIVIDQYIPLTGLVMAFKNVNYVDGMYKSPNVGFKNFEFLFNSGDAWLITKNTLYYGFVFIVFNLVLAVLIALVLNELRGKFKSRLYQTIFIMPYFLSMVVTSFIVYAFLHPQNGFVNMVLKNLGFESIDWYGAQGANLWYIILPVVNAWKMVGYNSVIYLASLLGIDKTYYEAATIDGATKLQQIRYITLPFIKPVFIVMFLLALGNIMRSDFGMFYQVTRDSGSLYPSTQVIDTYVYRSMMTLNNLGMSTAAGLYQSLVGFFMIIGANLLVRKIDRDSALI